MNIRICTPIIGNTLEQFLENLEKTQEISPFVELRVDFIQNIGKQDLDILRKATQVPAILTCRKKEEGGHFNRSEEERVCILQSAFGMFEYVDIELSTIQNHSFIRDEKTKVIVSYHNFEKTPSYWDMQKIIHNINEHSPDILKVATMIEKTHELIKIYRLLTNKPHTKERIVVGMGEGGKMSRILGPLLGGYLTYASTEYGESAPGQIELSKLQNIFQITSS